MLACLLAAAMAFEVRHDFIPLKDLDSRLEDRLNDGWEVVYSNLMTSYTSSKNLEAKMLFIFKKTVP